jgi:CBS domain-containing protein
MKKNTIANMSGIALAVFSASVLAAYTDPAETLFGRFAMYALILFIVFSIVFGLYAFAMKLTDKRGTSLQKMIQRRSAIHSVGPDTLVTDCVRTMSSEKIGALLVLDGEKLAGIFTERDALNRVLAAGLDPRNTKVAEVMTRDPVSVVPSITVGKAMEMVTQRHFRHLPVVDKGKVLALISSGDLTHWLVKDQIGEA